MPSGLVGSVTVRSAARRTCGGWWRHRVELGPIALVLALAGCASSTGSATTAPSPTPTVILAPTATASSTPMGSPIQVYFSKYPASTNTNFSATFPVARMSPTPHVETFAIQLLIAGPTPEERSAGYFSELNSVLTGPSTCSAAPAPTGGPDFTLTLNQKGATPEPGTATLRFCRATQSPGEGTDARILAEISATLLQFPTVKRVVVLTQAGHCFGDLSGLDRCLQ
jgi:hypothetical protein